MSDLFADARNLLVNPFGSFFGPTSGPADAAPNPWLELPPIPPDWSTVPPIDAYGGDPFRIPCTEPLHPEPFGDDEVSPTNPFTDETPPPPELDPFPPFDQPPPQPEVDPSPPVGSTDIDVSGPPVKRVGLPPLDFSDAGTDVPATGLHVGQDDRAGAGRGEVGPYGYGKQFVNGNGDLQGVDMGFGLAQDVPCFTEDIRANLGYGHESAGSWIDDEGVENHGFEINGGVFDAHKKRGNDWIDPGFQVGVATAEAGATHNENTTGVSVQANLISAKSDWGDDENNVGLGVSVGGGFGARAHHGDADGDGIEEMGFGFDAGPLSFDIRSEYIGRAAYAMKDFGNFLSGDNDTPLLSPEVQAQMDRANEALAQYTAAHPE